MAVIGGKLNIYFIVLMVKTNYIPTIYWGMGTAFGINRDKFKLPGNAPSPNISNQDKRCFICNTYTQLYTSQGS
jgi:hypothetical protein